MSADVLTFLPVTVIVTATNWTHLACAQAIVPKMRMRMGCVTRTRFLDAPMPRLATSTVRLQRKMVLPYVTVPCETCEMGVILANDADGDVSVMQMKRQGVPTLWHATTTWLPRMRTTRARLWTACARRGRHHLCQRCGWGWNL